MRHTRRDFLKTTTGGLVATVLGSCVTLQECRQQIAKRPTRRDVDSLAPNDPIIEAYKEAILKMKALPASDRRNWTAQARIHLDHCPHGNWLFLPWHRAYLLFFEQICRKLSGMKDFALPYWNWTKNPKVPAAFWGTSANPLFDGSRVATPSSTASPGNVGATTMETILNLPSFLQFASGAIGAADDQRRPSTYGSLEATPHNYIHGFVGGNMGTFLSPLDPLFWLHHNMIERCWVDWNLLRNHDNTNDQAWTSRTFGEFCDEDGNAVDAGSVSVAIGLLYPILLYQYDWPAEGTGVGTGGRARKLNSRNRTDRDEMLANAKRGSPVQVKTLRSFVAKGPATVALGRPATFSVESERDALAPAVSAAGPRSVIALAGLELAHTEDFFVNVFLNKPDASQTTPTHDPHFVGSIAFFTHPHDGSGPAAHAPTGRFVIDATDAIRRLKWTGGDATIQIVLVPFEDRTPKTRVLAVGGLELQMVHDEGLRTDR